MPRAFLNPDPALSEREYSMTEQRLSIAEEQAEFIDDFNEIDDWMMQYSCLLELTADMKPVSDEEKNEQNKISGCQADLWIILSFDPVSVASKPVSGSLVTAAINSLFAFLAFSLSSDFPASELVFEHPINVLDISPITNIIDIFFLSFINPIFQSPH